MEKINLEGAENIIGKSYSSIADELLNTRKNIIKTIINTRSVPEDGLDELTLELFLNIIAAMDSNNGINHIGIGEREGRVYSNLVKKRNFNMVHGIGRSGSVNELQPKAVGSSLLVQLTCSMTQNFLHTLGMTFIKSLIVLPFATGMAITLSLLTLKSLKPNAKYVIWPRIDQKTCFKSIFTANLTPVVIEPLLKEDELTTNTAEILKQIEILGAENILCIFSTTSCFAPRGYDNIKELAEICRKYSIYHLVNNAYGIYCTKIIDILNQAVKVGQVDVLISSTDKNFMVPVGGSIVYSSNEELINKIKKNYPGRASISPVLDLCITLLEMGKKKYKSLMADRKEKYKILKEEMAKIAEKYGEKIIENPNNKISIAMTLGNICKNAKDKNDVTYLGSLFYTRQISGIRIIAPSPAVDFNGYKFTNYGSHSEAFPYLPYCSFAGAIGITNEEMYGFFDKFVEIVDSYIASFQNKSIRNDITLLGESKISKIKQSDKEKKISKKVTNTQKKVKSRPIEFSISNSESFTIFK